MLTSIVITKNEQDMIRDCLLSVAFSDEVIVVDTGNTDATNEIAQTMQATIIKSKGTGYAQFRNAGLKAAHGNWVLYVDADERVTPGLRQEILATIANPQSDPVYQIPRHNIYLGKLMRYGGWGNDRVIRLFRKDSLTRYVNELHEQPEFTGNLGTLNHELTHFSHRDLSSMLDKTLFFTGFEADLRFKSHHPPMSSWRFIRVMLTEFHLRFIKLLAWKDGPEGIIDGLFQVFNMFVIYARLWEFQLVKT